MKKRTVVLTVSALAACSVLSSCGKDENISLSSEQNDESQISEISEEAVLSSETEEIIIPETEETSFVSEQSDESEEDGTAVFSDSEPAEEIIYEEEDDDSEETEYVPAEEIPSEEKTQPVGVPPAPEVTKDTEPTYIKGILIVNKTYPLPASYGPGMLTSETQSAFDRMQADAWAQGLTLWVASGFRSYERQDELYTEYVSQDGKELTDTYSARPGHSEHQTGLAFDINTIDDSFADTEEGRWVAENCHRYGFIIRYPKGKEAVTGYKYEPWHLRYLGTELAEDVYNSGMCLEEYLGITSEYNY